jgi:chorismate-pyruvate lyase
MNPLRELQELESLFPEPDGRALYLSAEHVAKEATPEPYHRMLVHEHHMTISMEAWHDCPVDVEVMASRFEQGLYLRKIRLHKGGTRTPVLFGYVRFNLDFVTEKVRNEIITEKIPLGRVLIQHNVFRHVDLGAILKFTAGPGLAEYLSMPTGDVTYGRLVTIFCNGSPAIDLLEVTSPL